MRSVIALVVTALLSLPAYAETGKASYYGKSHHGKRTACGTKFNMHGMTAAHKRLPCGTKVLVTNLRNGKSVSLTITDRGPFVRGRVIDVSLGAAQALGMVQSGVAAVRLSQ